MELNVLITLSASSLLSGQIKTVNDHDPSDVVTTPIHFWVEGPTEEQITHAVIVAKQIWAEVLKQERE